MVYPGVATRKTPERKEKILRLKVCTTIAMQTQNIVTQANKIQPSSSSSKTMHFCVC